MYIYKRKFTILELIVSMSVLVIMMTIMMRFFSDAQKAWGASSGQAEIYDNGRIAMDLITSDLNSITYSNNRGANFLHKDGFLGFFSYLKGDLSKVRYRLCTNDGSKSYFLTRSLDTDKDNDFQPTAIPTTVFGNSDDDTFKRIIPNVVSVKFTCYDKDLKEISTSSGDQFPWYVKVDIGLLGSNNFTKWKELKKVGKEEVLEAYVVPITKLIYLGYRGQN